VQNYFCFTEYNVIIVTGYLVLVIETAVLNSTVSLDTIRKVLVFKLNLPTQLLQSEQ